MPDNRNLIEGLVPFDSPEESAAYRRWISDAPKAANGIIDLGAFEAYYPPPDGRCEVDLTKNIQVLNQISIPDSTAIDHPTMPPLPTIPNYVTAVPNLSGSGRLKISAASLKNKVLACCRLAVKGDTVYNFDGRCYRPLSDARVKQLIVAICGPELNEAGRFDLVTGAFNFILAEPGIQIYEDILNRRILTFQNGNLDIETGSMKMHSPDLFTTYALNCNFLPGAESIPTPAFDMLLKSISGGNPGTEARIWELFGYCLVPDTNAKKGFALQGRKHSGKSLLCNFLEGFFPSNVVSALSVHSLSEKFSLSELEHAALCVSGDMPAEELNDRVVGHIKELSGNDLLSAPKKFKSNRQFRFGGKLILVSNHQILPRHQDDAFRDRLVAVPFPNTIPPEEQDGHLLERLKSEMDAVASKAVMAYWKLRKRSYRFSGDYIINSGDFLFDDHDPRDVDLRPAIQAFLLQNFEHTSHSEGVFVSDAHEYFQMLVAPIPLNLFGAEFGNFAIGMLNAHKERKRKPGESNPTSFIAGVKFKK